MRGGRRAPVVSAVAAALLCVGLALRVTPLPARPDATPRCFGAAARDPLHPCSNPRLALSVTPSVDAVVLMPNLACVAGQLSAVLNECSYGAPAGAARQAVAFLGDSHAAHWRAAIDYVAQRERWRVQEISRPHCPFSLAAPASTEAGA